MLIQSNAFNFVAWAREPSQSLLLLIFRHDFGAFAGPYTVHLKLGGVGRCPPCFFAGEISSACHA